MHEVSRRVWGLRLRRTEQELALALLLMLPTAHVKDGGVRMVYFRSWIPTPPSPCLRFIASWKAVENDCLTKEVILIRPCVPSHVAYEVEAGR